MDKSNTAYHILLVDDSDELCDLVAFMLRAKGWTVDCAYDGLQASNMLINQYDAIILDLQMPNMDGLQFLKQQRPKLAANIPVVVFTTHDEDNTLIQLKEAGADKILYKPMKVDQLAIEVSELIQTYSMA